MIRKVLWIIFTFFMAIAFNFKAIIAVLGVVLVLFAWLI